MKVRLGFAVAAHLEPEILIVDEVLAVGDAEFQRKCLGKMKNVAGHGRTVLFVSHNIFAMRSLCSRALLIDAGTIVSDGGADEVANEYIAATRIISDDQHAFRWETGGDFTDGRYVHASVEASDEIITVDSGISVRVTVDMREIDSVDPVAVVIHLVNEEDVIVFSTSNLQHNAVLLGQGSNELTCTIPAHLLNSGVYRIRLAAVKAGRQIYRQDDVLSFTVNEKSEPGLANYNRRTGIIRPRLEWTARRPV
jgi:lipopolysaccharide transport system ATP-binding protein